jgi:hypothetical protein
MDMNGLVSRHLYSIHRWLEPADWFGCGPWPRPILSMDHQSEGTDSVYGRTCSCRNSRVLGCALRSASHVVSTCTRSAVIVGRPTYDPREVAGCVYEVGPGRRATCGTTVILTAIYNQGLT